MRIINARLRKQTSLFTVEMNDGVFTYITEQSEKIQSQYPSDQDADGKLLSVPFVEPHIHLDAALTAGER